MKTIGARIKFLRQKHYLTQRQLSENTGISRNAIIEFEANKRRIYSHHIITLSKFFGVSTDWLLCGEGEWSTLQYDDTNPEEKVKYIWKMIEQLKIQGNEEQLQRLIDFIEFELRKTYGKVHT